MTVLIGKTTITRAEYLQLIGLEALAQHHNKALSEINRAAGALLQAEDDTGSGREPYYGLLSDTVYSERSMDETLRILGVTVAEGVPA